ncbi:metallophosphoesterase [Bacillus sp. 2205SS5-2]|uniref:metallophosphoesterase n=1 Tax=Bacillus sp. 2205SS5-2 TaxID=3109031 RepID=UPI0030076F86
MFSQAHKNNILHQEFLLPSFPEGNSSFRLFFISDIHRRKIPRELIKNLNSKVDWIVLGGDITESGVPLTRVAENIRTLKTIGPLLFVWGNNDYKANNQEVEKLLRQEDVFILKNQSLRVPLKNGYINFIGVDDLQMGQLDLEKALQKIHPHECNVLISHNPDIVENIHKNQGIDLILSGHTHGGQIRVFSWGLYKVGRVHRLKQTTLLVSNGYGTRHLPLRLGAKSETHIISLKGN